MEMITDYEEVCKWAESMELSFILARLGCELDVFAMDSVDQIWERMNALKYWMEIHSPFYPEQEWFAGFTPHATTGWNGVPDNQMSGRSMLEAVARSALVTLMATGVYAGVYEDSFGDVREMPRHDESILMS